MTINDSKKPSTVYLRPNPKSREVRYIESIEEAAMIVDHKHAIAMYTSKTVPNTGPQGPPGTPGESAHGFDTIIAAASDEGTPIAVGGPKTKFRCPYPLNMENGYVRISLTNPPLGSAFIVNILMNGISMFSTDVRIDAGMTTSVGSVVPAVLNIPGNVIPDDAEFQVYVVQNGASQAGTGLKVAITGQKVVD